MSPRLRLLLYRVGYVVGPVVVVALVLAVLGGAVYFVVEVIR